MILVDYTGKGEWGSMSDADRYDAVEHVKSEEDQMRQAYALVQEANTLPGADVTHDISVTGLMGELKWDYSKLTDKMKEQAAKLKSEGKNDVDINIMLESKFSPSGPGKNFK